MEAFAKYGTKGSLKKVMERSANDIYFQIPRPQAGQKSEGDSCKDAFCLLLTVMAKRGRDAFWKSMMRRTRFTIPIACFWGYH